MSFNIITHLFALNGAKKRLDTERAAAYLWQSRKLLLISAFSLSLFEVRASGLSHLLASSLDTGVTGVNSKWVTLASVLTVQIHISCYTVFTAFW